MGGAPTRAQALDRLIYAEIAHRRRTGHRGDDVLSLLLDAPFCDRHVRDHVMTLLFAGHDTTTATIAFLFYELARHPDIDAAGDPQLLDQALDETLRLYPPAWIGPRRAARAFEFAGHRVAEGAPVNYSSWASHRLPDVWDEPHAFRPERFAPEARKRIPKGAYVPFGGGSRICLGMRFGQAEIRAIATAVSERFRVELPPGFQLRIRQTPTLGPAGGLPVRIRVVGFATRKSYPRVKEDLDGRPCPDNGDRERAAPRGRGRAAPAARALPARHAGPHRHPRRV